MYTEILDCAMIRLTLANKWRVPTSSLGRTDRLENDNGYDYNTNNIGTLLTIPDNSILNLTSKPKQTVKLLKKC